MFHRSGAPRARLGGKLIIILAGAAFLSAHVSIAQISIAQVPIAQAPITKSATETTLNGSVLDPSDAQIADAEVDLLGKRRQAIARTKTDARGFFTLHVPLAAEYRLRIAAPGFETLEQSFAAGKEKQLHLRLAIGSVRYDMEVKPQEGRVSTEAGENKNILAVDHDALGKLPLLGQDYIAFMSAFLDTGALGSSGASMVVNGVEANGIGVSPSAIESAKINGNQYSALFARPGLARLEVTTKSGTEHFHGNLNFIFRDSALAAVPAFALTKPAEQRRYFEGSITGPLGNGKHTTFLASADYEAADNVAIVDAVTLSGEVHENAAQPMRHSLISGRAFHDYGQGNEFWIGYSFEHRTDENLFVGGLVLPQAGAHDANNEHEISLQHTKIISAKWLNQLRAILGHDDHPTVSNNEAAKIQVLGAFTGGGAQADAHRTETHAQFNDIVTYSSGRHELKFGIDSPDISRRGEDDFSNQQGAYTFPGLAALEAGAPQTLLLQRGSGHLVFVETNFAGLIEDTLRVRPNLSLTTGVRYYYQNFFHNDANNLAPRLGFAWKPLKTHPVILRGGAGVFYDRTGPQPIADLLHFDGTQLQQYLIDAPPYPTLPNTNGLPIDLVQLGKRQSIPYTVQWSVQSEQQLNPSTTLTVEWSSSRGIKQFRSLDLNAPLEAGAPRPDPAVQQLRVLDSEGRQVSNALSVYLLGAPVKWFKGQALYRLAKTYDDTSGINYFPQNSYAPQTDYARADGDRRNLFYVLGLITLPAHLVLGEAIGYGSGYPYSMTTGFDNNGDGIFNDRPAGVSRNSLTGPSELRFDLKLNRDFQLSKKKEAARVLTAGVTATNVLNHTNYGEPIGVVTSPYFGKSVTSEPPRRLQLNLSYRF